MQIATEREPVETALTSPRRPSYMTDAEWTVSRTGRLVGVPEPLPLARAHGRDADLAPFLSARATSRIPAEASVSRLRRSVDLERAVDAVAALDEEAAADWVMRTTPTPVLSPSGLEGRVAYAASVDGIGPVGFALATRGLEGHLHRGHARMDLWVDCAFVYVAPALRVRGLGRMLAACLLRQLSADVAHVTDGLTRTGFRGTLASEVHGDVRSVKGGALLATVSRHLAAEVGLRAARGLPFATVVPDGADVPHLPRSLAA